MAELIDTHDGPTSYAHSSDVRQSSEGRAGNSYEGPFEECSGISATYLRKWSDSSLFQVIAYEVYITQINLFSSSWSSVPFISSKCVSWLS